MSANFNTYQVGSTVLTVGLSGAVQFIPPAKCHNAFLQVQSGGGSGVAFMQSAGGVTVTQGYLLNTAQHELKGPATFFLAAQGTTALVGMRINYAAGFSSFP